MLGVLGDGQYIGGARRLGEHGRVTRRWSRGRVGTRTSLAVSGGGGTRDVTGQWMEPGHEEEETSAIKAMSATIRQWARGGER